MFKFKSLTFGFFSIATVISSAGGVVSAATFVNATVSATVDSTNAAASTATEPYSTPETALDDNGSSVTTPDFTGLVFKTTFTQNLYATSTASGYSNVTLTAGAGDTYSLFGSTESVGGPAALTVSLYDNSTSQYLYDMTPSGSTVGSASGALNGGDNYSFFLRDDLSLTLLNQDFALSAVSVLANNAGSGGITIVPGVVTPEPATLGTMLALAGSVLPWMGRRRLRS